MKFENKLESFIIGLACLILIYVWSCGDPPTSIPSLKMGNLKVTVMDTASIDSINISIDDLYYGIHENPCTLNDLISGLHKLFVYNSISACTTKTVEIFENKTTDIIMWMASEGPYPGNIAPIFSAEDIKGNIISLEEQKGKVVLLAFFEHT